MQYSFYGKPFDASDMEATSQKFTQQKIIQPIQTHSDIVCEITNNNMHHEIHADGVWTRNTEIILSVKTADCIGILLYNKEKHIVAALHAGWRGLAQKISTQFLSQFPLSIRKGFTAYISPSLQQCCSQFTDPYTETPSFFHSHIIERDEQYFVDLSGVMEEELINLGISKENITNERVCTKCNEQWWSYRDTNRTERNLSCITLGSL